MSMMCKPMWSFLLMYGSHDVIHIGFPHVDDGQRDPWEMGRHRAGAWEWAWIFLWRRPRP